MPELSLFSCARSDCPRMRHIAQKVGYHRHDDTLPLFLRMALTYIVSVRYCMNRGSANGAPAGGAFLVDIPEDWEPRAKQQPTGLIAYGTSCRRPVLVLHRPRKKSQVKRLGIFVVEHSPQQANPKDSFQILRQIP